MLPFKNIPIRVIIELVIAITMCLNMFPTTYGISTTIIPKNIVIGLQENYKKITASSLDPTSKHTKYMTMSWDTRKLEPSTYAQQATKMGGITFLEYIPEDPLIAIYGPKNQCQTKLSIVSMTYITTAIHQLYSLLDENMAME